MNLHDWEACMLQQASRLEDLSTFMHILGIKLSSPGLHSVFTHWAILLDFDLFSLLGVSNYNIVM